MDKITNSCVTCIYARGKNSASCDMTYPCSQFTEPDLLVILKRIRENVIKRNSKRDSSTANL